MIERTVSTTALAALAALEAPRALMTAAPRCWTVLMNSPFSQASSVMSCGGGLAVDLRVVEIRILRRGMVAPDGDVGDRGDVHAGLLGELRLGAVFIQARHGEEAVARDVAARCSWR